MCRLMQRASTASAGLTDGLGEMALSGARYAEKSPSRFKVLQRRRRLAIAEVPKPAPIGRSYLA